MNKVIETKSAAIDTLAVTIQALHVNGKQMTLAVFRQLPVIRYLNTDGSLSPLEYWGLVRYAIKDEDDLWAVCVKDGRLCRAGLFVESSLDWYRAELLRREAEDILTWWRTCSAMKDKGAMTFELPRGPRGSGWHWTPDGLPKFEANLADKEKHLELCLRVKESKERLLQLPQLFIAV